MFKNHKRAVMLLVLSVFAVMLFGCGATDSDVSGDSDDLNVAITGAEYEHLTIGDRNYEICNDSSYTGSDRDKLLCTIKNGNNAFKIYTIKGTNEYLYCLWDWEGWIYKLTE